MCVSWSHAFFLFFFGIGLSFSFRFRFVLFAALFACLIYKECRHCCFLCVLYFMRSFHLCFVEIFAVFCWFWCSFSRLFSLLLPPFLPLTHYLCLFALVMPIVFAWKWLKWFIFWHMNCKCRCRCQCKECFNVNIIKGASIHAMFGIRIRHWANLSRTLNTLLNYQPEFEIYVCERNIRNTVVKSIFKTLSCFS